MVSPVQASRAPRGILGALCLLTCTALGAQPYAPSYYGQPYYAPPNYGPPNYGPPMGQQAPRPSDTGPQNTQSPQFRPLPPTNAQGVPPTYQPPPEQGGRSGQMPYAYPGYSPNWQPGYPQGSTYPQGGMQPSQIAPPSLEWSLEVSDPYLQQPVVLKLDVISRENLSTANLELPSSGDALIKSLQGPSTSTRQRGGQREIVNTFVLTITPLRAGDLSLPPIKVSGTLAGAGLGQPYEARTERPIRLQVRPSMTSVRPWLPLKSLAIESSLDREGTLEPGQPITLAVELTALGATAVQLPSLEAQLNGPDFRVYREQSLTNTELSSDGWQLIAKRTEYYTLVPQVGGRISLPEMSIAWWNVDLGVREVARLPIKTLTVRGGGPFGLSASALANSGWIKLWIPLTGVLLLIGGYWVGVFYRGRPWHLGRDLLKVIARALAATYRVIATWAGPSLSRLAPASLWAMTLGSIRRTLPQSSQVIRCVRHANRAPTPQEWCARFEEESRSCLAFRGDFTQPALTRHILALRPGADPRTLARLMRQLDAVLYGREPIDFPRWKRELMGQVRRGTGVLGGRAPSRRIRWNALPALNPAASP